MNLIYFEGSALILSKKAITTILSQRDHLLKENQMDDVSIGVALPYQRVLIDKISDKGTYEDGIICYRNKSNNRLTDIDNLKKIAIVIIGTYGLSGTLLPRFTSSLSSCSCGFRSNSGPTISRFCN